MECSTCKFETQCADLEELGKVPKRYGGGCGCYKPASADLAKTSQEPRIDFEEVP